MPSEEKHEFFEIANEFYLIRTPEPDLHRNIYLKRFISGNNRVNMLFDPGTKLDTPLLASALEKLAGGLQNVDIVFLSHQDPDVASNIHVILANAPHAVVVSSIDTLRLIKMLGIPERNLFAIESQHSQTLEIKKTGHRVQFVPAYFCHFRGAMMFYDYESRTLFSGDFLAGVTSRKGPGIHADESSFSGIEFFHQIYMPLRQALRDTVDRITSLDPIPEVIAPQHGDVIAGRYVEDFLARISQLEVGMEIIHKQKPLKDIAVMALNRLMDYLEEEAPPLHVTLLEKLEKPEEFTTVFQIANGSIIDLKVDSENAVAHMWNTLEKIAPPGMLSTIKTKFAGFLDDFGIALPRNLFTQSPPPDILGSI